MFFLLCLLQVDVLICFRLVTFKYLFIYLFILQFMIDIYTNVSYFRSFKSNVLQIIK